MAKPIRIRFTYAQLNALNEVWQFLEEFVAKTPKEKAMLSVMQKLAVKFQKKKISIQYTYEGTSEYSIQLKDYEAYFLEMFFRDIIPHLPLGYARTIVYKYADFINQKLA